MTKILVIEDEDHIREEVIDWLIFEGYETLGARDGRQGLDVAKREKPDLILSDIAMPEMNGHELLLEVRSDASLSQTAFIFVTASADRASLRKGMELGADDYLTKPFTHSEVLKAINSRLKKKATSVQQFETQIKTLQDAFSAEREERLLKSRIVAMFSHDFRNPLAAILSSSNILRNYNHRLTDERRKQHFDRIDGSIHRLVQMLDDMIIVAEMEGGHLQYTPELTDVAAVVESIVGEFRLINGETHKILLQISGSKIVAGDEKLLRHIVANLISNAVKYSDVGSVIEVCLTMEAHESMITVRDYGIGIPSEDLQQLFEPFHRAENAKRFHGTGLGLAIVKEAVELHNGKIHVSSELGKGSTFTVSLSHHGIAEPI